MDVGASKDVKEIPQKARALLAMRTLWRGRQVKIEHSNSENAMQWILIRAGIAKPPLLGQPPIERRGTGPSRLSSTLSVTRPPEDSGREMNS